MRRVPVIFEFQIGNGWRRTLVLAAFFVYNELSKMPWPGKGSPQLACVFA